MEGIIGQRIAESGGDLAAEDRAERAVGVADLQCNGHRLRLGGIEILLELLHQNAHVGGLFKLEVIDSLRVEVNVGIFDERVLQQRREVHLTGAGACGGGLDLQQVGAAHQLINGAHAELCHVLTQILGHKAHKVHDVLGLAFEPLAQLGVLGADAHRAGVEVADAHHHAAHRNEGAGAETEFLGTQQGGDGYIAAAHQLAVGLDAHAAAQTVHDQALVCLSQTQFPRQTGVVDGVARCCAGAAVKAGNQDDLGTRLGHAGCNRADTGLADQLDIDGRLAVGTL